MTASADPTAAPLRPPPVRQATTVRSDQAHTFDTFVRTIGVWWPVTPFSRGGDRVRDVTIEPCEGGRVYETWDDGSESDWGRILAWDPPRRFLMSWENTPVATEVELSFRALGPALTRVAVEHRGWEGLTPEQLAADCAMPGGYAAGRYVMGWVRILGRFAEAAGGAVEVDPADGERPDGGAS
jgi:hypothetical protein